MRTLFADLYPVRSLLIDHYALRQPGGFSPQVRAQVPGRVAAHPTRAAPRLWAGLIAQAAGDVALRGFIQTSCHSNISLPAQP